MDSMHGLIGQTLGSYTIREQIGQGGMATVFKAYQPSLNRDIALKVLPPHFAAQPGFTERFEREAKAIGNLNHQNILPVHDSGQEKGFGYIAMRYIDNARTLADEMRTQLDTQRIIEIISHLASALNYAHDRGVIHRDVKPSNVLMDGDWPLLSDFGLAKMVEENSDLTGSGVGIGTPAYMSPEQGMGQKVDHRTDIYALGIILFEMLTGIVPHRAETPIATVMKRINEPLPIPRMLNPNIPEAAERVLLKALAPDPEQRFNSANEMADALKEAFGANPSQVLPHVSKSYGVPKVTPGGATLVDDPQTMPSMTTKPATTPSMAYIGLGAIGLVILLALCGIGAYLFMSGQSDPTPEPVVAAATATPLSVATEAPATDEVDTQNVAEATSTSTPEPPTPTAEPATETPEPELPTATPSPEPPTETPQPEPPTAEPLPAVAPALTAREAYDAALAEAQQWQEDVILTEMATTGLGPMGPDGTSTSWSVGFYSREAGQMANYVFFDGVLQPATPLAMSPPNIVPFSETTSLDSEQIYQIAMDAIEVPDSDRGATAALTKYPIDDEVATWYINYNDPDNYPDGVIIIIDADSLKVLQILPL